MEYRFKNRLAVFGNFTLPFCLAFFLVAENSNGDNEDGPISNQSGLSDHFSGGAGKTKGPLNNGDAGLGGGAGPISKSGGTVPGGGAGPKSGPKGGGPASGPQGRGPQGSGPQTRDPGQRDPVRRDPGQQDLGQQPQSETPFSNSVDDPGDSQQISNQRGPSENSTGPSTKEKTPGQPEQPGSPPSGGGGQPGSSNGPGQPPQPVQMSQLPQYTTVQVPGEPDSGLAAYIGALTALRDAYPIGDTYSQTMQQLYAGLSSIVSSSNNAFQLASLALNSRINGNRNNGLTVNRSRGGGLNNALTGNFNSGLNRAPGGGFESFSQTPPGGSVFGFMPRRKSNRTLAGGSTQSVKLRRSDKNTFEINTPAKNKSYGAHKGSIKGKHKRQVRHPSF